MYKTLLLLTALALVQARPNEDAVVTNAKLHEIYEAALAQSSNADDCETLDNGCPVDYTIHKIIPHEQNCQLFYVCDKGERVVMPCPEPLYFDAETQRCVWSWQTDCVDDYSNTDPTTTAVDFEATTDADDVEATTDADDVEDNTDADDSEDNTDADDIEATTVNGNLDIGDVLENGCPADIHIHHLLPHEECEKFYQCNFGEKVERDCAPGTVFHFEIQVCDWPRNVPRCAGSAGATARPPTTPDSEEAPATNDPGDWEALPNGCPANSSIPHLLPHESECDKYYVCDNGRLIEMGCPTATHFSPSQQKCTWPHEAGCEHWTGGGCSKPDSSCGGSTATPNNSTTPDSNISTTPPTIVPENSTTTATSNNSTTPDSNISTTPPTAVPENSTTTATPNDSTTPDSNISTTPPTIVPENSTTTATPNNSTTPDSNISTTPPTIVPENSTTTATPNNSTTPDSNISTTPPTIVPENSTTTATPNNSTTPDSDISTTPPTIVPENSTTTATPNNSTTPDSNISTTPPTIVPENSTTTAAPIESTTPDFETTTELLTVIPENSTTTAAPIDSTTDEITTISSTDAPEIPTTTTEEPPCVTEVWTVDVGTTTAGPSGSTKDPTVLPEEGTTATPGCPICPTVPVSPAQRCKQGCNVAPWAHEECDKYYSCIGDEFRLNICAEGLHFNPNTFTCDFICNAGCVRNVPQITRHPDGVLMFVPNSINSKMNMMELIEHELNGDL